MLKIFEAAKKYREYLIEARKPLNWKNTQKGAIIVAECKRWKKTVKKPFIFSFLTENEAKAKYEEYKKDKT